MHREDILRTTDEWIGKSPDLKRWTGHLTGGGVPKIGPLQEYVPGFYGRRTIDPLRAVGEQLACFDQDLATDATARQWVGRDGSARCF